MLVVDDQRDSAEAVSQLRCLQGDEAEPAYDSPHALERARGRRPELVLLDLGMPSMDGFEVARRLRELFCGGPPPRIVALTGRGQDADRQQTQAAGFDGHLAKPPSEAELRATLMAAVKARETAS